MSELRVALLGAFSFPAPQGSQVFARDQALALQQAGASVSMFCYGRGVGAAPEGVELVRVPAAISPRSYRSGLHPAKPLADAALVVQMMRAARQRRIDVILAHNAEAAFLALLTRAAPTLYVAHTLFEEELGSYGPVAFEAPLTRLGARIDRAVVRRVDATIALAKHAAEHLAPHARGPLELLPPGIFLQDPPDASDVDTICSLHGLEPGSFALYAGNLDRYQDLALLRDAAALLPDRLFVAATHLIDQQDLTPVRVVGVGTARETRALIHGAAIVVAPRQRRGGFPIKLLNYMEAGRAIVAREDQAHTLVHGCSALLVDRGADAARFAEAVESLFRDPERAATLGRAAYATARSEHDWGAIARRTLALAQRVSDP